MDEEEDLPVEHWLMPVPGQPGVGGDDGDWRCPVGEDGEEDTMGGAAVVPISSLILVLPPAVATDKVACPSAFLILWKTSSKRVSSSTIFASESEV